MKAVGGEAFTQHRFGGLTPRQRRAIPVHSATRRNQRFGASCENAIRD